MEGDGINFNLSTKRFSIRWHGYNSFDISTGVEKDNDFYYGKSWIDAVNQFLESRFNHGPKFFYIDSYEEWDADSETEYDN